jgi:hypothetical protein
MLRYHAQHGDQWTKIGSFLGRSGMSVHHKFLELNQTNGERTSIRGQRR